MNEKCQRKNEKDKKMSTKRGFIRENYHISPMTFCAFIVWILTHLFSQPDSALDEWINEMMLVILLHLNTPFNLPLFTFLFAFLQLLSLVFVWGRNDRNDAGKNTKFVTKKNFKGKCRCALWGFSPPHFPSVFSLKLKWCNDKIKQSFTEKEISTTENLRMGREQLVRLGTSALIHFLATDIAVRSIMQSNST